MLFDHRPYTCKPGTLPKQLALYEEHGKAAQERHLGKPSLFAITETGPINTYVHVWVYEDAAAKEARLAGIEEAEERAAERDREWKSTVPSATPASAGTTGRRWWTSKKDSCGGTLRTAANVPSCFLGSAGRRAPRRARRSGPRRRVRSAPSRAWRPGTRRSSGGSSRGPERAWVRS